MNKIKSLFAWLWQKIRTFWPWYKGLYQGKAWYTKTLVALASCIVAFILYLGAVDINFLWLFGKSPGYFSGILDPQTSEASEIYSADGKLIGKYFNENRTPVEYDEVTPDFKSSRVMPGAGHTETEKPSLLTAGTRGPQEPFSSLDQEPQP